MTEAYARTADPETSHEAAGSISGQVIREQTARILAILDAKVMATDEQIYREYVKRYKRVHSAQSVRSRRAELTKHGRVEFSGRYGTTSRGGRSRMWQITS